LTRTESPNKLPQTASRIVVSGGNVLPLVPGSCAGPAKVVNHPSAAKTVEIGAPQSPTVNTPIAISRIQVTIRFCKSWFMFFPRHQWKRLRLTASAIA
jgi:hypothetical protein